MDVELVGSVDVSVGSVVGSVDVVLEVEGSAEASPPSWVIGSEGALTSVEFVV